MSEEETEYETIHGWMWCRIHKDMADDGKSECNSRYAVRTDELCDLTPLLIEEPETLTIQVLLNGDTKYEPSFEMKPEDTLTIFVNGHPVAGVIMNEAGHVYLGYFTDGEDWHQIRRLG